MKNFLLLILFFSLNFLIMGENLNMPYSEQYREQYHYSPLKGWANDPNGLVYFNKQWHMFYQYYPFDSKWGPMHWGHAISKDLIHWEEKDIALFPENNSFIFSGSAVVDKNNTSGLFNYTNQGGLILIYTTHSDKKGHVIEQQSLAYSLDDGVTWIKYNEGKPIVSKEMDSLSKPYAFRDPKIFFSDEANKWMMIVAGGPVRFFSSNNLIDWKVEGTNSEIDTECPDFFKMKVDGSDIYKWVLTYSGRYYQIGDFKNINELWKFVPLSKKLEMNFGKDSYAGQSFFDAPDNRRLMINWMNNWEYANDIGSITKSYNGQFTLINELKLAKSGNNYMLYQSPIKEYESLRKNCEIDENFILNNKSIVFDTISSNNCETIIEFKPDDSVSNIGVIFKNKINKTVIDYNCIEEEISMNRVNSGVYPNSSNKFLNKYNTYLEKLENGTIKLHIFIDSSSIEAYINNGISVGSLLIFPEYKYDNIEIYSTNGFSEVKIKLYSLNNIWDKDNMNIKNKD